MVKIKHHSRKFLNKSRGLAAIETHIDSQSWGGVDGTITIGDCSRQISLDFCVYEVKDLDDKLAKLNLLIDEVSKFRDVYVEHYDSIKADIVTQEKERKKKKKDDEYV
jgi:hypothetical protein